MANGKSTSSGNDHVSSGGMIEEKDVIDTSHTERVPSEHDVKADQWWDDAKAATQDEHDLTIRKALKLYPIAVMWSLIVSMSIIMEGYDTNLIGNVSSLTFINVWAIPNKN